MTWSICSSDGYTFIHETSKTFLLSVWPLASAEGTADQLSCYSTPRRPACQESVVLPLSQAFDVLFQCALKRTLCHINQGCSEFHTVFSVNPRASARFIEKKVVIFVAATFRQTSPADAAHVCVPWIHSRFFVPEEKRTVRPEHTVRHAGWHTAADAASYQTSPRRIRWSVCLCYS